ncbi:MAG: MFS transporter [Enterobacteriaceae bacterium]
MDKTNNNSNPHVAKSVLAPVMVFSALVPLIMLTAPAVASQLTLQLQLSAPQIGYLFSAELGGMSLATVPAYWWQSRFSWQKMAFLAAIGFIIANLATVALLPQGYGTLLIMRFLSALFGGTLMILCLCSARLLPNPDRAYGLWLTGQLALSALALVLFPFLFARFGIAVCYLFLAGLALLSLPLVRYFPKVTPGQTASTTAGENLSNWPKILGIIAVLLFYICIGGVWTFVGELAIKVSQLTPALLGTLLAVATLMGVCGALLASLIGTQHSRQRALNLGYALLLLSMLLLLGIPGAWRYGLAILLFKTTWTFVLPFILAAIASIDRSGQLINTTNLVIGGGLAIGPGIAGQIIGFSGSYQPMLIFAMSASILSLLLLMLASQRRARQTR